LVTTEREQVSSLAEGPKVTLKQVGTPEPEQERRPSEPSRIQNVLVIDITDDTDRRVDDLRARLQELNGRLAVPQIEHNARAHMVQEIGEVEAEIARLLDEQTRRFGGA